MTSHEEISGEGESRLIVFQLKCPTRYILHYRGNL